MTEVDDLLSVDCESIVDFLSFSKIAAINVRVTEPSKYGRVVDFEGSAKDDLESLIEFAGKVSDEYSGSHSGDSFGLQQEENLQNLLDTEFKYICSENNDLIYLSAVLMHRITAGHPFEEGNKRTAYLTASIFLMEYQLSLGHNIVVTPELDSALQNSLEDIAMDESKMSPEQLANVYRASVEKKLGEVIEAQSS